MRSSRLFQQLKAQKERISMRDPFEINKEEPSKIVAERINGWAAMMGFWAAVGAYLTTGQIIPGLV